MILYQLAKWNEERELLLDTIKETEGDISMLMTQKQQVKEQKILEANRFFS